MECKEYKPSLSGRVMDENQITQEQIKKNISNAVGGVLTLLLPNEQFQVLLCNVLIFKLDCTPARDCDSISKYFSS